MVVMGNPYRLFLALSRAIVPAHVRPSRESADDKDQITWKGRDTAWEKVYQLGIWSDD